ncbi:Astra associated protein 1 Asa1 [Coniosporium apollinis]|uniref:ASTRA-associated protein 1 n=2 Tax=Coniosporium TaxID=2810619 RepID=A0ABQ9P733_9PEZI|nr:Astra associated protein 1 Asa1 [Cladosporium sp. JES 115]KAJ9669394.1 Astra associated protein 1 Asa1 [Coniosporium apollinis]
MAVPGTRDSQVDVFQLPSERRILTVPDVKSTKTGMIMAIRILYKKDLIAITGYESGHAAIHAHSSSDNTWQLLYLCNAHTQPILSLDASPDLTCFFTSSADATIGKHPLIAPTKTQSREHSADGPLKAVNTGHAGQQSLRVRDDGKIYATAGWDGRVRVYSTKTMKELAVLKWHEEGVYAVAFAEIDQTPTTATPAPVENRATVASTTQSLTHATGSVSQQRDAKARTTHWLAAGSKDGKVSLWDIY